MTTSSTRRANATVRKQEQYAEVLETKITKEEPSKSNPFSAESIRYFGYEHFDLIENTSYSDFIFLLMKGELPKKTEGEMFSNLCGFFINPGIRSHSCQAAIAASVSKADKLNILPIGLSVLSGKFDGAGAIEEAVKFYRKQCSKDFEQIAKSHESIPGFERFYGATDTYAEKGLQFFNNKFESKLLQWGENLNRHLKTETNVGISRQGLFAMVAAELGFLPKSCGPMYQLISAPGILAHSLEFGSSPITSYFFESDEDYYYEP